MIHRQLRIEQMTVGHAKVPLHDESATKPLHEVAFWRHGRFVTSQTRPQDSFMTGIFSSGCALPVANLLADHFSGAANIWNKRRTLVPTCEYFSELSSGNRLSRLLISNATANETGTYTCTARRDVDGWSANASANVDVTAPPMITSLPKTVPIILGQVWTSASE